MSLRGVIESRIRRPPARRSRAKVLAAKKITHRAEARGLYRIFNTAEYRFYRSQTAPPVEKDTPFATNATLPHQPTETFADGTWYLSVSYYNGIYDSGFLPVGPLGEPYWRLDLAGGVETTSPPAGPLRWDLQALAGGVVRVVGLVCQSGDLRAEEWALAYTTDGSTPPADSPDATQAIAAEDLAYLDYELPAVASGTPVQVRLQTRRNDGSWVYSEGSEVKSITPDLFGPSAPLGMEG